MVLFLTSSCRLGNTKISCQRNKLIVNETHKCICCQMANSSKWSTFPRCDSNGIFMDTEKGDL
eukprot:UN21269